MPGPRLGAPQRDALRAELLASAAEGLARLGHRFAPADLVEKYAARGVSAATLFRWLAAAKESGRLGAAANAILHDAADRLAAGDVVMDVAATVARLPALTDPEMLLGTRSGDFGAMLDECIRAARTVMGYAVGEDGRPRAAKLLLAGSEHLRRVMETASRFAERMHEVSRIEEFQRTVIEETRKESPECAQRILRRLDRLASDIANAA